VLIELGTRNQELNENKPIASRSLPFWL
jgi:hypothetical protein